MSDAWPALPLSDAQRRAATQEAEAARLAHLAADALAEGGEAVELLLLDAGDALARLAPDVLARLRAARLCASREAEPAPAAPRATISLGALALATPVWAVAPMVTQCDAPFRLLTRRFGARLVYSEMLLAGEFAESCAYRARGLGLGADGQLPEGDHPLLVQFAANDPATLLRAALAAQACGADGVDINLGCPQNRAREGHYGSFLAEPHDWDLVCRMVRSCVECGALRHCRTAATSASASATASRRLGPTATPPSRPAPPTAALTIPVTAKIRLQPTVEATVEFGRRLEHAGIALLAVHGRRRGNENNKRSGAPTPHRTRRTAGSALLPPAALRA